MMMRPFQKNFSVAVVTSFLFFSGCLKTRAQLREEENQTPEGAHNPVREVQTSSQYVVEEMKQEITRLNGRIEDLERGQKDRQGQSSASQDEIKKLENRVMELEKAQLAMIEAIKKLEAHPVVQDPKSLLEQAESEIEGGKLESAIETLGQVLKNPKSPLAETAYYLRGQSYFKLKDYKKAIVDFSKFPEKYSKSPKMPEILFKIGQSFDAMGMKEDAKSFYLELREKFPKSPEAKKARHK